MSNLHEKCAVVGASNIGEESARYVHDMLWAMQHRGQESSGIAVSDGEKITLHKGMGLVAHVYRESDFDSLSGSKALGHNRYSTQGGSTVDHAQPVSREGALVTSVHNGNLPVTEKLETFLSEHNVFVPGSNDSEMMTDALSWYIHQGASLEEAIIESYPLFTGAFSFVVMTKDKVAAVRDPFGIRPLSIGKLNGGYVFVSETCALDAIEARYLRDVKPGEMVVADDQGLSSYEIAPANQKLDIFEFVYFARPDSRLLGRSVNEVRHNFGVRMAKEYPISADIVIPIPDSGIPAAEGYAEQSGIVYKNGFVKNRYIHRTFIRPGQRLRETDVKRKLNPLADVISGKRVIVIDDSIVRATTAQKLNDLLRGAGAIEVHFVISSPPVKYPDFYGIDTRDQRELAAATMPIEHIRKMIGADSLHYLSFDGMIEATGLPESVFCTSCFTGEYPIDIGRHKEGIIFQR